MTTNAMPLGDRIFDIVIGAFIGSWALGWVILIGIMVIQALIPKIADRAEATLQRLGGWLSPVMKYALWTVLVLVAIRVASSLLGWGPPMPLGDPGDFDRRP